MSFSAPALAFVLALPALALAACSFGRPIEEQHPSVQQAPASEDDSTEAKQKALAQTIARDLGCEEFGIVLVLERRYANSAAPRYVIEGCGQRALYAETCESYPSCRYLLVSLLALPSEAGEAAQPVVPAGSSAAAAASSAPAASAPPAASGAPTASAAPRPFL